MEETISLKELFATLRKRLNLIIVVTILAVMISGIVSFFFLTPIYQVSTQLLVNQAKSEETAFNYNEVQTNLQLINTYNVIIKSPAILDIVREELDLDMSSNDLNNKITVSSEQNSQVVNIDVQDESPQTALKIANKVADVFQSEVVNIMNVDNVKILAKAEIEDELSPVKPQPLLNIAIGLVIGLMVGVGLAFLLEYLDNTIKSEQDVEKYLNIPVLGVIPTISEKEEVKVRSSRSQNGRGEVRHV